MVDGHTGSDERREGLPEEFPYRVFLAPPTTRTIPIFAIGAVAARPQAEAWSVALTDDDSRLDRQAYGHLRKGHFGSYRFVVTRHKQGLRIASYAPRLAFSEEVSATAFVTNLPRYSLSNLLADAQRRKAIVEHDLRQGLTNGRFDLSNLSVEERYRRANLYVASMDQLARLNNAVSSLDRISDRFQPG